MAIAAVLGVFVGRVPGNLCWILVWLSYLKRRKVLGQKLWGLCGVSSCVLICRKEETE